MEISTGPASEFQYVPVPTEHVMAVMAYINELAQRAPAVDEPTGWTVQRLQSFATSGTKTARIVGSVWDLLAENPEQQFTIDTLSELTGEERQTLKTVWTHLSRHINKHYAGLGWPMHSEWGGADGSAQRYWFTKEEAARWIAVRRELDK